MKGRINRRAITHFMLLKTIEYRLKSPRRTSFLPRILKNRRRRESLYDQTLFLDKKATLYRGL